MNRVNANKSDIPVPAALLLLVAVGWIVICGPTRESLPNIGDQIESFMDRNGALVAISAVLVFLNVSKKKFGSWLVGLQRGYR